MMKSKEIINRLSIILGVAAGLAATLCCSSKTPDAPLPSGPESAAELIAQADHLYAEREDLSRLRSGIVSLRRALAAERGNYEAAWRLAKFDYYLGAHTTD